MTLYAHDFDAGAGPARRAGGHAGHRPRTTPAAQPAAHAAALATARTSSRPGLYRRAFKRGFDILFVLATAPVVLPVVLLVALAVAFDGHNPFYAQRRVGLGGRVFRMWKIRTMVPDADATLERHLAADPALRAEWQHHQKLRNDPRITPLGRVLRKTSLDELPQFLNVLTGEMSVVGPRPMMLNQAALYPGASYYALRPGVTGPWQVSDRNASSFAERARFDDSYHAALSLGGDLSLLARTVAVMLRGTGC